MTWAGHEDGFLASLPDAKDAAVNGEDLADPPFAPARL